MKAILYIAAIILSVLLISCTEQPTRDNPYDPGFDLPEPEISGLDDISLTSKLLSWDYDLDNIEGFMINRRDDTEWQEEILIAPVARTWLDTLAAVNKHIQYKIKAIAGENESDYVSSVILDNMMTAVDSFTVSQVSVSRFLLTWQQDNIIGEDGFIIKRKIDEEVWEEIAILEPDTQEYEDDLAVRNFDMVFYQIYSFVGEELSPPAVGSSGIFFPGPAAVEYEKLAINRIKLTWQEEINGEEGFYIDLYIDGECLERYAVLDENTTEWIDEQAPLNHDLQYKVYAFAGDNTSNYTVTSIIDNTFPMISNLIVEQQNVHQFSLSWEQEHIIGENGYIIQRGINGDRFQQIADLAADTEEFLDDICQRDSLENVAYQIYSYLGEDISEIVEVDTDIEFILNSTLPYDILEISRIKLLWQDTCSGEEGFRIDRHIDGIGWVENYGTVEENAEEWIDEDPPVNGYVIYRVHAFCGIYNSNHIESEQIYNYIPAPTELDWERITLDQLRFSWQDNSAGEDGYKIARRIDEGNWANIAQVAADSISWLDEDAPVNVNLTYRICAYYGEEESDYIQSGVIDNILPAVEEFTMEQVDIITYQLNWNNENLIGVGCYRIWRQVNNGEYVLIAVLPEQVNSHLDNICSRDSLGQLSYKIIYYIGDENSPETIVEMEDLFHAPSNLEYDIQDIHTIHITWQGNNVCETGYRIDKKVGIDNWDNHYGDVDETEVWVDYEAEPNEDIQYRIYADFNGYQSDKTESEVIDNTFPAPDELQYYNLNIHDIRLTWLDNSSGEEGFKIDKKVGDDDWQSEYAVVAENIEIYIDYLAEVNEDIQYRVYAYYEEYESAMIGTGVIENIIPAPSELELNQINVSQFQLTWQDNCIGEHGYRIERKIDEGNWLDLGLNAGDTYLDDLSQRREQTYNQIYYRIRAEYNDEYSNWDFANTPIEFPAPANLAVEKINYTEFELSWEDNSINEDGFIVERMDGTEYVEIGTTGSNQSSFNDNTVEPFNTYSYRVTAYVNYNAGIQYTEESNIATVENDFTVPGEFESDNESGQPIVLNWQDNSLWEEGFIIERKIGSGDWNIEATLEANTETWEDNDSGNNAQYYYKLYAYYQEFQTEEQELYVYHPNLINTYELSQDGSNIRCYNDVAFVGENTGLCVYDISTPGNFIYASELFEWQSGELLFYNDNYCGYLNWVENSYWAYFYDYSNIYNPECIAEFNLSLHPQIKNIHCDNNFLTIQYCYNDIERIKIYDISDINNILVYSYSLGSSFGYSSLVQFDNIIYIISGSDPVLRVFEHDIENSQLNNINNLGLEYHVTDLHKVGDYLYTEECYGVGEWNQNSISIIDISDPLNPVYISRYEFPWSQLEMYLDNIVIVEDLIFAECRQQNIQIIDISNKYDPVSVGSILDNGECTMIGYSNNFIYSLNPYPSGGIGAIIVFDE